MSGVRPVTQDQEQVAAMSVDAYTGFSVFSTPEGKVYNFPKGLGSYA